MNSREAVGHLYSTAFNLDNIPTKRRILKIANIAVSFKCNGLRGRQYVLESVYYVILIFLFIS